MNINNINSVNSYYQETGRKISQYINHDIICRNKIVILANNAFTKKLKRLQKWSHDD